MRIWVNLLELIIYCYGTLWLPDGHCYCNNCQGICSILQGPLLFYSTEEENRISANSPKSSSSSYYHCNHTLFPLLAALLFPIKGIKCRSISKRENQAAPFMQITMKINSQQENPGVTNIAQVAQVLARWLSLPPPWTTTLIPKDRARRTH